MLKVISYHVTGGYEKDINTAFENSKITSEENQDTIIGQGDCSHFIPLFLSAINDIKEKKKLPGTSSIHDYIMKIQALNADKALIDSVIVKLKLEGKIIDTPPPTPPPPNPQGLDSFYDSTKEIDNIHKTSYKVQSTIRPISICLFLVKLLQQMKNFTDTYRRKFHYKTCSV